MAAGARDTLAEAVARRAAAERAVDELWHDAARRSFRDRVLVPLDAETARFDAALRDLEQDLARALIALA